MQRFLTLFCRVGLLGAVLLVLGSAFSAHAQQSDPVTDLVMRVNRERITRGLTPYTLNPQLTSAAQSHAEDMSRSGNYTRSGNGGHIGSDGSSVFERVARTNYGAYSWGRRLGENWAWYRDAATAMTEWMQSPPHRNNILHALYREIGVGSVTSPQGGFIYVLVFGAQPNRLPISINDGAPETKDRGVSLTLSDEQVSPNGDGAGTLGHPVQVQISNLIDFADGKWQPYETRIPWTLAPGPGNKTVYVKYRDAKGRTAVAFDSIVLNAGGTPSPAPFATLTMTRTPRSTARPLATGTPTAASTSTLTVTPSQTSTIVPSATATETPTQMPSPSPTEMATPVPAPDTTSMAGVGSLTLGSLSIGTVMLILMAVLKDIWNR